VKRNKIKAILTSNRGESLLESIVSILVFSILVASVTMILTVAMQITNQSFGLAEDSQNAANRLQAFTSPLVPPTPPDTSFTIHFTAEVNGVQVLDGSDPRQFSTTIQIGTEANGNLRSFRPVP
jgi:Tfp pilus assembly protein PilV